MKFYYREEGVIKEHELEEGDDPFDRSNIPGPILSKIDTSNKINGEDTWVKIFPTSKRGNLIFEDESIAEDQGYIEDPFTGHFIKKSTYRDKMAESEYPPAAAIGNCDLTDPPYSKNARLVKGCDTLSYNSTGHLEYKFGVELETCSGLVPSHVYYQNYLSLKCEKDGSLREPDGTLRGGEYVTGILVGDMGMSQLYHICKELGKRCKVDKKAGLHVHIGYTYFTKDFSVMAYILGQKIQDDFFSIVPQSRRKNPYCNFLPDNGYQENIEEHGWKYGIEISYSDLMHKLANGRELGPEVNKAHPHPDGRWAGSNGRGEEETMRRLYRYKWLNLIPSNFNQKRRPIKNDGDLGKDVPFSIEFRHHSGTLDIKKVRRFVLLCMAFVYYVDNHKEEILEKDHVTLEDIVDATFRGDEKEDLLNYVQHRRSKFSGVPTSTQHYREYNERPETKERSLKEILKV